jgi:endonuclease/exonuclease/phosphatase family metal-dependent hydrolase
MKLISLNTWSGRGGNEALLNFFKKHKDTDIFCLQEVWEGGESYAPIWANGADAIDTKLVSHIKETLTEHDCFFRPHYMDWYGLAMFAKKGLNIREEGDIFVFKERQDAFTDDEGGTAINHARNLQYMTITTEKGKRTIANFHGLWNGKSKEDTPERLLQADNITRFFKDVKNPFVLCGDFNLLPENESLKNLESFGMKNLIKEFGITSTRSSHYKKPVRFADYTLVSKDIKINEFKVLPDEVSDHLAMYLDFE